MKLFKSIIFFLVSSSLSCMDYPGLYQPFQRDVIFLIDWSSGLESLSYVFHGSFANIDRSLGSVASKLAAGLYEPSVPIIASTPTWITILERAQFIEDGQKLSEDKFVNKYLNKYKKDPDYKDTLLINSDFLKKLFQYCKKSFQALEQANAAIAQQLGKTKDLNRVGNNVSNLFRDETFGGFLKTTQDQKIWKGVAELLMCYVVVQKVKAERNKWIIKKADECIYLFIPKTYLENVKNKVKEFGVNIGMKPLDTVLQNSLKDKQTGRSLTVEEIILGIKMENFPSPDPFFIPPVVCQEKIGSALSDSFIAKKGKTFSGILPRIIINADDLGTFKEDKYLIRSESSWVPHYCAWNVYGLGHGSPPLSEEPGKDVYYYVMGLRENAISAYLDFFDSINTYFLFYTSCYAAGHRLRSMYLKQEQGRIEKKKYHYIIVVGAITQIVTTGVWYPFMIPPYKIPYGITPENIDEKSRSLKPKYYPKFGKFFSNLHIAMEADPKVKTKTPVTYEELLLLIEDFTEPHYFSNIPQIRFSGSAWFNVIDLGKEMIRLTQTYVRTKEAEIKVAKRSEDKKLVLRNKKLLLIDAEPIWQALAGPAHSEIQFPLVFQQQMPTIISMVAGNAWHRFKKIDAQEFGCFDVIKNFWGVPGTFYGRTYYIDELIVKNDLKDQAALIGAKGQSKLTLKNVYIFSNAPDPRNYLGDKHLQGVMFKYNDKLFSSSFSLTDPTQMAQANKLLQERKLPNLQNIPGPVPDYTALIKKIFPQEKKEKPISLEEIAQFIADKKKQQDLLKQYEEKKKAGPKPLELWKKMLTENERQFIELYEASLEAAEQKIPLYTTFAWLSVELQVLKNILSK